MKIIVARHSGFCFGVTHALQITRRQGRQCRRVEVLGALVHNESVVRELESKGIRTISRVAAPGRGKTLIIRAHGVGRATMAAAHAAGYRVVDATCPMVKGIHAIARAQEGQGYRVVIIGDHDHAEVKGIAGQLQRPGIVIDPQRPLPRLPRTKKLAVVVQSTQDIDTVLPIVARLRTQVPGIRFFNTICNPTRQKQAEIQKMARQVEAMIIVGSRHSANTRRLFELSRALNLHTYAVEQAGDIEQSWIADLCSVGVAAGASTPQRIINAVVKKLQAAGTIRKRGTSSRQRRSATRR